MMRATLLTLAIIAAPAAAADFPAQVRSTKGEAVNDAIVSLTPLDTPVTAAPVAHANVIQSGEQYAPFVTAVTVGTEVAFPNEDKVQHHLYSVSKPKRFEKPLYAPGATETVVFDQPGAVALGCNIHDWMVAYILVLPTPYYAKTDSAGRATVTGLTPGRYRVEIWHPRLGEPIRQEVTVGADTGTPAEFSLTLRPDRRIRRATDGKAGGY